MLSPGTQYIPAVFPAQIPCPGVGVGVGGPGGEGPGGVGPGVGVGVGVGPPHVQTLALAHGGGLVQSTELTQPGAKPGAKPRHVLPQGVWHKAPWPTAVQERAGPGAGPGPGGGGGVEWFPCPPIVSAIRFISVYSLVS